MQNLPHSRCSIIATKVKYLVQLHFMVEIISLEVKNTLFRITPPISNRARLDRLPTVSCMFSSSLSGEVKVHNVWQSFVFTGVSVSSPFVLKKRCTLTQVSAIGFCGILKKSTHDNRKLMWQKLLSSWTWEKPVQEVASLLPPTHTPQQQGVTNSLPSF